jgi:hypothetical protein
MKRRTLVRSAAAVVGAGALAAGVGLSLASPAEAATAWPAHVFAPYVDTGLYYGSGNPLTTWASDYGTQYYTLAFVDGAGCSWSLPSESTWQPDIAALQAEGGDVSVSFGGYTNDSDGDTLGTTCSSASAMAAQVENVITTLGVTHLDFDIESNEQTDTSDLDLTAQALSQVRSWASSNGKSVFISYTIPVLPTGFTSEGLGVIQAAAANGFTPNVVNIMTMDYGTSGTEMGQAADQAIAASAGQIASTFDVSSSAAYAMLGVTPMIGQNDSAGEIFTLADASTVESYAASQNLAWTSFWSEGRDNGGCSGSTSASSSCSGITQNTGQFTQIFQAFTSGGSTGGGGPTSSPTPTPTPTPTVSSSPTGGSGGTCAAAWVNNSSYTSGNEVSYNGDNWTANQWNYDEVPGGASGAWNNDGAC